MRYDSPGRNLRPVSRMDQLIISFLNITLIFNLHYCSGFMILTKKNFEKCAKFFVGRFWESSVVVAVCTVAVRGKA